jgi:polyphenol oxidase
MTEFKVDEIAGWRKFSWLRHGFSRREGGVSTVYGDTTGDASLNLGWTKEDAPASVKENRRRLVDRISGEPGGMRLVTVRQVHGNTVHRVRAEDALAGRLETPEGHAVLEGDGLVTDHPGVLLAAGTADCVPVLIIDPERRAVGAFHAGWRGTAARIVEHGVRAMAREFGSRPEDLLAAVGPSIGTCCYTVGEEVWQRFTTEFLYGEELFHRVEDELRVDLWEANRRQLLEAGLPEENIAVVGECTGCARDDQGRRRYFSHRMEAGKAGRMLNVVGIAAVQR